jgi:hypothetical protein
MAFWALISPADTPPGAHVSTREQAPEVQSKRLYKFKFNEHANMHNALTSKIEFEFVGK